ncbi:hypothetical protein E2A64_10175 [Pseudohoeflea suaedae]|uniref:Uncharacterized protein n=1 Tax=Pseudohoeflea suaedae TaxID=877384 RepID=A0A4R5PJ68_9HYPH|nr:hypothetical protein [Pseudohoeflea suaedae]TDH35697.1 hypothetical protein E2A64_10175 [Pseudohoeflea suaedae]
MEDGWIEWNGGECPVEFGSTAWVKLRYDERPLHVPRPEEMRWQHGTSGRPTSGGDIIAYRVVKP